MDEITEHNYKCIIQSQRADMDAKDRSFELIVDKLEQSQARNRNLRRKNKIILDGLKFAIEVLKAHDWYETGDEASLIRASAALRSFREWLILFNARKIPITSRPVE